MKGVKTVYICSECTHQSTKWLGRCPSCGAWNSFVEDVVEVAPASASRTSETRAQRFSVVSGGSAALPFSELSVTDATRTPTG
ncbi:MAG: DNA repair protein RadA, partial [Clostridia bacterium]|nr:DNA repair protein RadA [Clostridia bacterium]